MERGGRERREMEGEGDGASESHVKTFGFVEQMSTGSLSLDSPLRAVKSMQSSKQETHHNLHIGYGHAVRCSCNW